MGKVKANLLPWIPVHNDKRQQEQGKTFACNLYFWAQPFLTHAKSRPYQRNLDLMSPPSWRHPVAFLQSKQGASSCAAFFRVCHSKNTPIQIYRKFHLQKLKNFQIKTLWQKHSDIFHISAQNIDCGYSLEPPRRGGSNEYPQSTFLSRNKKNSVYPCKLQFYYIKVGFKGIEII